MRPTSRSQPHDFLSRSTSLRLHLLEIPYCALFSRYICLHAPTRSARDHAARRARQAGRANQGLNSTIHPHHHSSRQLVWSPLRAPSQSPTPFSRVAWLILECARSTSRFQFSIHLFRGVAEAALYCAHRTIYMLPPSLLVLSLGMGAD